jgi:hypothetical protein
MTLAFPNVYTVSFWSGMRAATSGGVAANGAWIAHENGTEYYQLGFFLSGDDPSFFSQAGPQASGDRPYLVITNRDTGTRFKVRWATESGELTLVTAGSTTDLETNNTFTLSSVNFALKLEGPDDFPTFVYAPA